ncbi:MAG TPA: response regulator [Rubrobacteraceae bacterium]|nr:response regulator [Rubrobacteraceae bacterium]
MTRSSKILLVEDDPNDVELTLSALTRNRLSCEIAVVRDGQEALDYLLRQGDYASREEVNPPVVLLDLKLPKVSGIEVLERVKTDPYLRTVPVVVLTSSREERDVLRSYDLGTNAYVVKPVDFQDFSEAVKQLGLFWTVINQAPPDNIGRAYEPHEPT